MLKKTVLARRLGLVFATASIAQTPPAIAQTASLAPVPTQEMQRVTVTGSNIRRTDAETPSPVQVITAEDMKNSGLTSVQDVLHAITANGQGTLSQSFSQAFASGAGGIALRGLNVGATLVLIDGRRMAPYPIGDDGQASFVDISNIPFDAVERIEVLKDGASAVYGSDAIAGVVNVILKRTFEGARITADTGLSAQRDGATQHLAATFGKGNLAADGRNAYLSVEVRKQQAIRFTDRGGFFTQSDFTGSGGYNLTPGVPAPGNPSVGSHAASGTGYVTDASGNILAFMKGCDATRYSAGLCTYRDNWAQIQPRTENYNLVGRYTQKLGEDWQASLQSSYFQSKSQQVSGPGGAFSAGFQGITSGPGVIPTVLPALDPTSIPSTNPSFPVGTGFGSGLLRYTLRDVGPMITYTDSKASRLIGDVTGRLGDWSLDASAGYTQVLLSVTGRGRVDPANLQTALNSTTEPYLVGGPNAPSVLAFVAPTIATHDVSKLYFGHAGASRDTIDLRGGPLSIAFGVDYLRRSIDSRAPAPVAAGRIKSFSNNYTVGSQTVGSAYGEVVAPVSSTLELDGAVRYDHYNLSGGKASPKAGFKFTPVPEFAVRGTASKGFRAPGPAENGQAGKTFFAGTSNDPVLCADGHPKTVGNFPSQCSVQQAGSQSTSPGLKPEISTSYTFGLILEPVKNFSATLDFYQIEIKDQIVAGGPTTMVRGTNFTPIDQVQADGSTALTVPPVAPIAYVAQGYINANSTKTNGVDLGFQYRRRFEGVGDLKSDFNVSYTNKYDITIDGVTYRLAGTHGPSLFSGDTGNPRTRIQWSNTFRRGPWQVTGAVNYIGSYSVIDPSASGFGQADQSTCLAALKNGGGVAGAAYQGVLNSGTVPSSTGCRVASFTTVDLTGKYDLTKNFSLHGAVLNLLNRQAPLDWATYGGGGAPWNPSLHLQGGIGRYLSVGANYAFD